MYNAVRTGVVKINRLPPSFFDALFRVKSVSELQHLIVKNSGLFNRLLADESIPKTTRSFLRDFVSAAHSGRLNETAALKAIPLLYSMATRAGGNSQIRWTVFEKSKTPGIRLSEREMRGGRVAGYALHPRFVQIGEETFELLNESGNRVLRKMSDGLLQGQLIPWARVDYRTARPVKGKNTFAIIDVGMGTVGTFEKDAIARQHGLDSRIAERLVDSILHFHSETTRARPKTTVIALSNDYFDSEGMLARSAADLEGLRKKFMQGTGSQNVFLVPYSKIRMSDSSVFFDANGRRFSLGKNDLMLVYNPNKPMEESLERELQKHLTVVSSRRFAAISDKRVNSPFILAAKLESEAGRVIAPRRGPLISVSSPEEFRQRLAEAGRQLKTPGVVVKLPTPIEIAGKALPSALFFNPKSELQLESVSRALRRHFDAGARQFTTEQLIRPHAVPGAGGGMELRFYYSGKQAGGKRQFRRR